jgi:hypothetical protein
MVVFGGLALFLYQPVWLFHWSDFRTGNEIVSRVEAFRARHNGALPETLEQIGISDEDQVFYEKVDRHAYIVWFGTTLGESETYDSRTKKWD